MTLGERLRQLRREQGFTLRRLAAEVEVGFTYLSKLENQKTGAGHGPSEALLCRLARVLKADKFELLNLAGRVPQIVHDRALQHPVAFRRFAELDDEALAELAQQAGKHTKYRASS